MAHVLVLKCFRISILLEGSWKGPSSCGMFQDVVSPGTHHSEAYFPQVAATISRDFLRLADAWRGRRVPRTRSPPTRSLASPPRWLARGVEARSLGPGHTGELINPTGPLPQRTGLQTRSCHVAPPAPWPPLPPALASHHPIAKEPPSARKFSQRRAVRQEVGPRRPPSLP